jgi:Flp pilus assembly protein TadG
MNKDISSHLPWIVPLLMTLAAGGFQIYSLIGQVKNLERAQATTGRAAIEQLSQLEHRVSELERYCCEDAIK